MSQFCGFCCMIIIFVTRLPHCDVHVQIIVISFFCCNLNVCNSIADVAVFDAGDVYTAGLKYGLIPFISEVYNLGEPEYYAVAVAREEDPDTELTYMKGIASLSVDEQYH